MSETTTELEDEGQSAPEEQPEQQPEGQQAAEGGEQQPQTEEKPKPERRQAQHLRARIAEVNRRAEEAEARAARAEALLAARGNGEEPAKDQPQISDQARIEEAAARLLAKQRVEEQRGQIIQAGVKEFGAEDWNEKTDMLATMGALGRPEFMEALADLPDAHRVIVALADDPDQLSTLLAKRPAAMAAALGRMAAELSVDKPKQEISKIAAPIKPVTRTGREPPFKEPEPGTREWFNWRNQTAPKHLGGEGKSAA